MDQNRCDAASVDSAMQILGETRRQKILDLIGQIQSKEKQLSDRDFKKSRRRRKTILLLSKKVKLLDEVGLQPRVESLGAMKIFAKQLKLIAPDAMAKPQLLKPDMTLAHQMKARPQGQVAVEREQDLGAEKPGDADLERESLKKTKGVIDLIGDSDDDNVFSVQINTTTQQKRNDVVAGRRISNATARELQHELRDLGVGDTGKALPPKRRVALL